MTIEEVLERAQEEMRATLGPLKRSYTEIDGEITKLEGSLVEARAARDKLRRMIRQYEPEFGGDLRKTNGKAHLDVKAKGPSKGGHRYKPETISTMTDWFQTNATELNLMNDGKGFYSSRLVRDKQDDLPAIRTQSAMSYMLDELHRLGIVRLSSVERNKTKYFKVIV